MPCWARSARSPPSRSKRPTGRLRRAPWSASRASPAPSTRAVRHADPQDRHALHGRRHGHRGSRGAQGHRAETGAHDARPRRPGPGEQALAGVTGNAALVAVQPSTGDVLAVVNRPADSTYNRAIEGLYPPGSTFKVVTTAALLGGGLSVAKVVNCPPTIVVDGRSFRNFEGGAAGAVPFSTGLRSPATPRSCRSPTGCGPTR